jgi:hypothetical protein
MITRKYHLQEQEIPDGYQIYESTLVVMGVQYRKEAAQAFANNTSNCWLELDRDEDNKFDNNAIKVIGCNPTNRYFIGYVPKESSKLIIEGGFWGQVIPRLLKTYIGDQGFVEILFQLLGPIGKKYQYLQTEKTQNEQVTGYVNSVDRVKQLMQDNRHPEAIELLYKLIDEVELEAKKAGRGYGVAPWYYEQLAVIFRKEKHYDDEVEILERYARQPKSPGAGVNKLSERLGKARELLKKQNAA